MDRAGSELTPGSLEHARNVLREHHRAPEPILLPKLLEVAASSEADRAVIRERAAGFVHTLRRSGSDWIAEFLREYALDTQEGLTLLSLAESYLRVPDAYSAGELLRDKLGTADWRAHMGSSASVLVNTTTFALALAGALTKDEGGRLQHLLARSGEPFLRGAVAAALRVMARHFVLGESIEEGIDYASSHELLCSFDMLGEAARTAQDAQRYLDAYRQAIEACGRAAANEAGRHSVSIKLSALHPRYETLQARRAVPQLTARLAELAELAADRGIGLTVDAEESERLEMSLDIVAAVARLPALRSWEGLGLAVQAYQKRAYGVIEWAQRLACDVGKRLTVRLVKGAYWDTEIKRCQERGLVDYPVWLRKAATDVSYLACARRLLQSDHLYPAFATHNALTIATLLAWTRAQGRRDFEFQRLHGMAAALQELLAEERALCRVYAPIGGHRDLLAYLVRRLLENGANTSFIHQVGDASVTDEELLEDPLEAVVRTLQTPVVIPLPSDLFGSTRRNSAGLDLTARDVLDELNTSLRKFWQESANAAPISTGIVDAAGVAESVRNPAKWDDVAGEVIKATAADVDAAVTAASLAAPSWERTPVAERVACLQKLADLLEQERFRLIALLIREAGKTRQDALSEVREAVDYCRYYAAQASSLLEEKSLPGPTGEDNRLHFAARGVFACISPWNFPLAIFLGQITAALATGNAVVAKSAPQTPLIAAAAIRLALAGGVPADVLHLLPGGAEVGDALVTDSRVQGVVFTGSTATGRKIARRLLEDPSRPLVPLIAETGGINAMIVDSTALTEQVCNDALTSAFQSAGQRCSALRLLCLQEEVYDKTLEMLRGAMAELVVGDPADEATDVGPLIDEAACKRIATYLDRHRDRIVGTAPLPQGLPGWFVAPTLLELERPEDLAEEVFGPVLHIVRWQAQRLEELIDTLNRQGYGLTMGIHTRMDSVVERVRANARVGNLYVNRTMIGAVVGSQPFGGEGLSGTGPKAGGPHYLPRFCVERAISIDTTSAGGNASLFVRDP